MRPNTSDRSVPKLLYQSLRTLESSQAPPIAPLRYQTLQRHCHHSRQLATSHHREKLLSPGGRLRLVRRRVPIDAEYAPTRLSMLHSAASPFAVREPDT